MSEKFQNKYRNATARLQNWNYGANGAYFITICTHDREHYFGEIIGAQCIAGTQCIAFQQYQMQLSEIGKIVESEWLKTPVIRPDMNLQLGAFVVMPNHFHGIIIIGENKYNTGRDAMHCAPTANKYNDPQNHFGPQSKNLASIIRGFKSAVTMQAKSICHDFAWQSRYYDIIIRNPDSFARIQYYIENNPGRWVHDNFNL